MDIAKALKKFALGFRRVTPPIREAQVASRNWIEWEDYNDGIRKYDRECFHYEAQMESKQNGGNIL